MTPTDRGKTLFEGLANYQLPQKDGVVRDYVFYMVPSEADHGYGWSAREFFKRFYKNHNDREVKSLEGLINELHSEVTQHGVQQIREIIIVTHANSQAMLFPILAGQPADVQHSFPYVNDETLARFQKLLIAGEFPAFEAKRDAVIPHLHDDSWVTIRGCNFGNAHRAMYATFSFFGGRADVYAPTLFQHFGVYPMGGFARLNTPSKYHSHLVHQHFYPKEATPERKRTVVSDLYEPKLFSERLKVASMKTDHPDPADETEYNGLVDTLNEAMINASLSSKLAAVMAMLSVPNWSPSTSARITVAERDKAWTLQDNLTHENVHYHIFHDLYEEDSFGTATLWVQASLSIDDGFSARGARANVIIQLFLNEDQDNVLHGRLFRLAGYAETDENSERRDRFTALRDLLKANKFADAATPGIDIKADFKSEAGIELAPNVPLVRISPAQWIEPVKRAVWTIDDATNHYFIKLENPATRDGAQAHTITVYTHLRREEDFKREMAYLADNVANQDTPGTELAASFDRLSIDDLLAVIDYLRTPFKPGTSLFIQHAQQAIKRKRTFGQFLQVNYPQFRDPSAAVLLDESAWELHTWEKDDKSETSYEFSFNDAWFEVKALMATTVVQHDLFCEEDLAHRLNIQEGSAQLDPETDSPSIAVQQRTTFEAPFATNPLETDKGLFDKREESSTANCEEFAAVITKVVAVKSLDPAQIDTILHDEKTPGGESYFDAIKSVASKYSFLSNMANFTELINLPWLPSSADNLITEPIKRILTHELESELSWWIASEGSVVASTVLLQTGLALLWVWSVVMIPAQMLVTLAEEEVHSDDHWEMIGELTAVRQWLRRVEDVTYQAVNVPDLHEIDVSTPVSTMPSYSSLPFANEPYYIGRYFLEQYEYTKGSWSTFIWPTPRMKEGFDRGVDAMKFHVADELVKRAESGVDEALKRLNLDSCQISVLINAGILDIGRFQAQVIGELAGALLKRLPRV